MVTMKSLQIVHLEDDGPLRDVLKVALELRDPECLVHQFVGSNDALHFIERNFREIDLFVLDIRVPGTLNGLQVAERIRELKSTAVIVITSAYKSPERDWLQSLSCEWYPKPWHIMETSQRIVLLAKDRHPA
jgi:DNA-binding response OmpR family regulator